MTDIMKLADNYAEALGDARADLGANAGMDDQDPMWVAMKKAQAALRVTIEALLGDLKQVKGFWKEAQLRNRNLLEERNDLAMLADQYKAERDALQAKLDELQRQEPVNVWQLAVDDELVSAHLGIANSDATRGQAKAKVHELICWSIQVDKDLAAPKALEPLTDCRIELVTAIHTLASHYENRLHRLDVDDRKLAEGDIAHAIKIASKWNWNGITKGTP